MYATPRFCSSSVAAEVCSQHLDGAGAALQPLHMQPVSHPSMHRRVPCKQAAAGRACSQLLCRQGYIAMFKASLQEAALQLLGVHAV